MAKKPKQSTDIGTKRPKRAKLSAKESLSRMQKFPARKERFVAAVRQGKNRSLSA
jgi:hypothetical protein